MLQAAEKIESYTSGFDYDQFNRDDKTQDAVIRQFEIIGEAARQLKKINALESPNLPWTKVVAMRNKTEIYYLLR